MIPGYLNFIPESIDSSTCFFLSFFGPEPVAMSPQTQDASGEVQADDVEVIQRRREGSG